MARTLTTRELPGSVDLDENGDVITGHIEVWKIEGGEIVSDRQVPVDLGQ